jgi:hydrogenase maturation protease
MTIAMGGRAAIGDTGQPVAAVAEACARGSARRATSARPTLLLALGNDILGDDAVGLIVARTLRDEFAGVADVVEAPGAGFVLLECLEGYDRALIVDSFASGAGARHVPGTILELSLAAFDRPVGPSPHYASLAEVVDLARALEVPFPSDLRILALAVEDPYIVREGLSDSAQASLPSFVARARDIVGAWSRGEAVGGNPPSEGDGPCTSMR